MNEQLETFEHAKRTAVDLAIQFGPKILAAALIVLAPLYRGGNRPIALLVLECVALAGLAALAVSPSLREAFTVRPGVVTGFLGPNGSGKKHHSEDCYRPAGAE